MSQDMTDLLKVLAVTLLVFAVSTVVMLYVILLARQYGGDLPIIGTLRSPVPPALVPLLAGGGVFATLAAVHLTSSGLALLLTSNTIDMALLITAKAVAVVIVALAGLLAGQMVFLQLTERVAFNLNALLPALIGLAGFLLLSTALSVPSLRQLGNLRFVAGIALILAGPLLLAWL